VPRKENADAAKMAVFDKTSDQEPGEFQEKNDMGDMGVFLTAECRMPKPHLRATSKKAKAKRHLPFA
jgi:hypothetical protein